MVIRVIKVENTASQCNSDEFILRSDLIMNKKYNVNKTFVKQTTIYFLIHASFMRLQLKSSFRFSIVVVAVLIDSSSSTLSPTFNAWSRLHWIYCIEGTVIKIAPSTTILRLLFICMKLFSLVFLSLNRRILLFSSLALNF